MVADGERGGPTQRGGKEGKEGEQRRGGRGGIQEELDAAITEEARRIRLSTAVKEASMALGRVGSTVKKNDGEGRNITKTLFLPLESLVEPGFNQKLSD